MAKKKIIAVFDFDGTLTTKDTLLDFIQFSRGKVRLLLGCLLFLPLIILMKLRLYPNGKCKQLFFSWFFKDMPYAQFKSLCQDYQGRVANFLRNSTLLKLKELHEKDADIYVVTASIEDWTIPICEQLGVKAVLGTKIEVDENGIITGSFSGKNCYGKEKVLRLLEKVPDRQNYCLYAYGDSRGDYEMISFADFGFFV